MKRSSFTRLGIAFVALALAGCGKDDKIVGPGPTQGPLILSEPFRVLVAYEMAYEARDTVEMNRLYDVDYQGTSIDMSNPGGIETLSFTKSDEVRHVSALAHRPALTSVSLDFPPVMLRERDDSDPPGWALIRLPPGTVRLEIYDSPDAYLLNSSGETFEFRFIPTTPDTTSPTDTTWKIIRWTELKQ